MFDNPYVSLSSVLDILDEPIFDSENNPINGRIYSGILAKFAEGIPKEFAVTEYLHDNSRNGDQESIDFPSLPESLKAFGKWDNYSSEKILSHYGGSILSTAKFKR